jgi:hypothetical protein
MFLRQGVFSLFFRSSSHGLVLLPYQNCWKHEVECFWVERKPVKDRLGLWLECEYYLAH